MNAHERWARLLAVAELPSELEKAYAEAHQMQPQINERVLSQQPDLIQQAMQLVFNIEQIAARNVARRRAPISRWNCSARNIETERSERNRKSDCWESWRATAAPASESSRWLGPRVVPIGSQGVCGCGKGSFFCCWR